MAKRSQDGVVSILEHLMGAYLQSKRLSDQQLETVGTKTLAQIADDERLLETLGREYDKLDAKPKTQEVRDRREELRADMEEARLRIGRRIESLQTAISHHVVTLEMWSKRLQSCFDGCRSSL